MFPAGSTPAGMNRRPARDIRNRASFTGSSISFAKVNNTTTRSLRSYRTVHRRSTHPFGVTSSRSLPAQSICVDYVVRTLAVDSISCLNPYLRPTLPNTSDELPLESNERSAAAGRTQNVRSIRGATARSWVSYKISRGGYRPPKTAWTSLTIYHDVQKGSLHDWLSFAGAYG